MIKRLYIVAPCTNRKRLPVPADLQLRAVTDADLTARARAWCDRVEKHLGATTAAAELYAGDHWTVVRTLSEWAVRGGFQPELWVMSAGYGVVADTAPLHPYSVTFAVGHPDSVGRHARRSGTPDAQAWWACLGDWRGPQPGAPRSLEALIRRDPGARMLVLGSPEYIWAAEKDLEASADLLEDPTRLIVVSSRAFTGSRLAAQVIVSDASAQPTLGGARVSLHARVARRLLQIAAGCGWDVARLRPAYQASVPKSGEGNVDERARMTDEEIRDFIAKELAKQPRASATGLLRQLRQCGRACEQGRFKTLFVEVRRSRHGA